MSVTQWMTRGTSVASWRRVKQRGGAFRKVDVTRIIINVNTAAFHISETYDLIYSELFELWVRNFLQRIVFGGVRVYDDIV